MGKSQQIEKLNVEQINTIKSAVNNISNNNESMHQNMEPIPLRELKLDKSENINSSNKPQVDISRSSSIEDVDINDDNDDEQMNKRNKVTTPTNMTNICKQEQPISPESESMPTRKRIIKQNGIKPTTESSVNNKFQAMSNEMLPRKYSTKTMSKRGRGIGRGQRGRGKSLTQNKLIGFRPQNNKQIAASNDMSKVQKIKPNKRGRGIRPSRPPNTRGRGTKNQKTNSADPIPLPLKKINLEKSEIIDPNNKQIDVSQSSSIEDVDINENNEQMNGDKVICSQTEESEQQMIAMQTEDGINKKEKIMKATNISKQKQASKEVQQPISNELDSMPTRKRIIKQDVITPTKDGMANNKYQAMSNEIMPRKYSSKKRGRGIGRGRGRGRGRNLSQNQRGRGIRPSRPSNTRDKEIENKKSKDLEKITSSNEKTTDENNNENVIGIQTESKNKKKEIDDRQIYLLSKAKEYSRDFRKQINMGLVTRYKKIQAKFEKKQQKLIISIKRLQKELEDTKTNNCTLKRQMNELSLNNSPTKLEKIKE